MEIYRYLTTNRSLRKNMSPCQIHDYNKEKVTKLYL